VRSGLCRGLLPVVRVRDCDLLRSVSVCHFAVRVPDRVRLLLLPLVHGAVASCHGHGSGPTLSVSSFKFLLISKSLFRAGTPLHLCEKKQLECSVPLASLHIKPP
jgi:hypothetical protein